MRKSTSLFSLVLIAVASITFLFVPEAKADGFDGLAEHWNKEAYFKRTIKEAVAKQDLNAIEWCLTETIKLKFSTVWDRRSLVQFYMAIGQYEKALSVQDHIVAIYERKAQTPDDISAQVVLTFEKMTQTAIREILAESKTPTTNPADPVAEIERLTKQLEAATDEQEKHQLAEQLLKLMFKVQYSRH